MTFLIVVSAVAVVLFVARVIGEAKNIRALRLPGTLAILVLTPLAYEWGLIVGHGRGYVIARSATCQFLAACLRGLEEGQNDRVVAEMKHVHARSDESEKMAGSFFMDIETFK